MHRAEKSSSKICRSREVERAQELHRRKITGVRSYLSGIISKPSAARPPNAFRRSQASICGTIGSSTSADSAASIEECVDDKDNDPEVEADAHSKNGTAQSLDSYQDDEDFEADSGQQASCVEPSQWFAGAVDSAEDLTGIKSDEFRPPAVLRKAPPPVLLPTGPPPKKSLNRAFRVRKLREIEATNVGLFDRIKKSAAHYRNDDLRREWRQNVSYLSSICEFPLAKDMVASPPGHALSSSPPDFCASEEDEEEDLSFLAGKHASISAATVKASTTRGGGGGGSCLPSIQPSSSLVHPIKAIPTSPKKTPLNLAPAFRSLRKAMPQQPALPPITSPSRGNGGGNSGHDSSTISLSTTDPTTFSPRRSSAGVVLHNSRSEHNRDSAATLHVESPRRPPPPTRQTSASRSGSSTFIGDLQELEGQPEAPGDLKYQLLKTGRFVGGTYLVLTVFCGDGVRNAYGFDVFAFHREQQCEYSLSVTREMAHELIEASSSSLLAAETEAAAGTNWSMQQIARSICDHVQFATLEAGKGEVLFLVASVAVLPGSDAASDSRGKASVSGRSLLVDAVPHLMALCVHQVVELDSASGNSSHDSEDEDSDRSESPPYRLAGKRSLGGLKHQQQQQQRRQTSKKRRLHIFASTCASTISSRGNGVSLRPRDLLDETSIRFQAVPHAAPNGVDPTDETRLETEMGVDELYLVLDGERDPHHRRISLERMVAAAVTHLHIISVPSGGGGGGSTSLSSVRDALILNARVNPQLRVCVGSQASGSATTTSLQRKRSRQQLQTAVSPFFAEPSHPTVLLQTGLVWRDAYLLAQVSVVVSDEQARMLYQPWRWKGHQVRDIDESIAVRVLNPASGLLSERVLTPASVDTMLEALRHLASPEAAPVELDTLTFAKKLLGHMQLDADLFGAQVVAFPELERSLAPSAPAGGGHSPSGSPRATGAASSVQSGARKRPVRIIEEERYPSEAAAAVVLQAHFRGFLCR